MNRTDSTLTELTLQQGRRTVSKQTGKLQIQTDPLTNIEQGDERGMLGLEVSFRAGRREGGGISAEV